MFENSSGSAVDYIMTFSHSGSPVKDLSRIKKLLSEAGDPQESLKFVHIAGTNGKGSMAQMFSCIFTDAGLKTGLFTSPYMLEYADRIRINGKNIPENDLAELAEKVKDIIAETGDEGYSQFEVTQTIAFMYFAQQGCDVVVLETGMGGLLDCTNVVKDPLLTVIGSVDYDHMAVLGDTLEEIAAQKAGIIKQGVPCVMSAGNAEAAVKVITDTAAEKSAKLVVPDAEAVKIFSCGLYGSEFEYNGGIYSTAMGGEHQIMNALTVIEGAELIKEQLGITFENVFKGISEARLIGRTEAICSYPLTILDGAHNPDGLSALAELIAGCGKKPVKAVIGMCRDKNIAGAVSKLIPVVDSFVTVNGFSERAEDKNKLAEIINSLGGKVEAAPYGIMSAVTVMQSSNPDGLNLICGSLFLAAEVKKQTLQG